LHAVNATADAAVPEGGHLGGDPAARADAEKLVAEWFARSIKTSCPDRAA
jgi:hypothetical protein